MKAAQLFFVFLLLMSLNCIVIAQENQSEDPKKLQDQKKLPSISDSAFVSPTDENAARFLALEKGGKRKRIKFFVGEEIMIKLKEDKMKYKVTIQDIKEDAIVVRGTELNLGEIRSITMVNKKNKTRLLQTATTYLPIAGVAYLIADVINLSIISISTVAISGTLIAGGLLLNLFKKRTFRLGKKKYLKTVELIE